MEGGEVLGGGVGPGHERHIGGGGADHVRRAVLAQRVEDDARLEAVGQRHGGARDEAGGQLADRAGDVEQRGEREERGAVGQDAVRALPVGVVADVAVGVHRALGEAAGARGVADQRDVAGGQAGVGQRRSRGARVRGGEQVLRVVRRCAPLRQDARVVPGLQVEFTGRQRDPHRRTGRGPADVRVPGTVGADQGGHPGVLQYVGEFALLVHGVDGHDRTAGLPGAEQGDGELRHVLQDDRQPVAAREAAGGQVPGEPVGQFVERAVGQPAVEVRERGAAGDAGDDLAERVQQGDRRVGEGVQFLGEVPQPGLAVVRAHASRPSSSFRCTRFMPSIQRSVSPARAV